MKRIIDLRGMKAGTIHEKDYRPTWGVKTGTNHEKDYRPTWDENRDKL